MFERWKARAAAIEDFSELTVEMTRKVLSEQLGPKLKELANDDAKFTLALKVAHLFLPLPVRLIVSKKRFVEFGLKNRNKILGKVNDPSG